MSELEGTWVGIADNRKDVERRLWVPGQIFESWAKATSFIDMFCRTDLMGAVMDGRAEVRVLGHTQEIRADLGGDLEVMTFRDFRAMMEEMA